MKGPFKITVSISDGNCEERVVLTQTLDNQEDLVAAQDAISEAAKGLRHSSLKK